MKDILDKRPTWIYYN